MNINYIFILLYSFFYSIWPFTQSLAELLFNLDKVADLLQTQLSKSSIEELPAYLQLVSVLAR